MASPGLPTTGSSIPGVLPVDTDNENPYLPPQDEYAHDELGRFILDDGLSDDAHAIWADFQVINYFEYDYHRYMAGITSPAGFKGDKAAFFQLATPTLFWMSRWTACRIAVPPDIPDPTKVLDPDWVLLDSNYEPAHVVVMPDTINPVYRISGLFVYGHKDPLKRGSIQALMNYGRPPWLTTAIPRNVKYGNKEVAELIDGFGSPTGRMPTPGNPGK